MIENYNVLENLPFGVLIFDSVGVITDANKKAEQILKFSADKMLGKEWSTLGFKLINQERIEFALKKHPIIELLKAKKDIENEVVGILHANFNNIIWVNINVAFESNKEQQKVIMYLTDVSDVLASKIETSDIIGSLELGSWSWNIKTGGADYCNQWAQMLGYTLDELGPLTVDVWRNLVHPVDLEIYDALMRDHISGKTKQCECELRMLHKDGHWEWMRDIGRVTLWSDTNEPLYMSGIHENISDFKENELNLSRKIKYGKILNDISTKFINTDDIDTTIINSFARIASLNQASRVYLFKIDTQNQTMSNTHEWCNEGVSPQKHILQDLPLSTFSWWIKNLSNGNIININDVSKMTPDAKAEKDILEEQDVKSIYVLPISIKQSLIGFIGFDNVLSAESWSIDDTDFLLTTVSIFSYALDRQQTEVELRRNYLNLQAYFNSNTDFIIILNEQGEIIEINKQVSEKLGYTNEDVVGKHVLMLHPAEYSDEISQAFLNITEDKFDPVPLAILTKSMNQILVEINMTKGYWNGEKAFFTIYKDISEKVFSEQKFEKIFHHIPIIACLIDFSTGKYIEVNSVFCEKLGYTPDEVIGNYPTKLLGVNEEEYGQVVSALSENGFLNDLETIFYHKDGTPIDVLFSATSITLLDKTYYLALASDITERKKSQQQLIEAKLKAEESDRLKSAFLTTMNHELRTPLNHIIGFSSLLPDMTKDENIKNFSQLIQKSGNNLMNIIEDIFDLAKMEHSNIVLDEEYTYVGDMYMELEKVLRKRLSDSNKDRDIQSEFYIDSNTITKRVLVDKSKVMQVVTNFIRNAVKFTHKGVIALEILIEDNNLSFIVKDTGIGIPEDKQSIIFEFFRQVDDSHTRGYEGVGIGLTISQKIANAMRGKISLKSTPEVGSEFKFSFPI